MYRFHSIDAGIYAQYIARASLFRVRYSAYMDSLLAPYRLAALATIALLLIVGATLVISTQEENRADGTTRSWGAYGTAQSPQLPLFVTTSSEEALTYQELLTTYTQQTNVPFTSWSPYDQSPEAAHTATEPRPAQGEVGPAPEPFDFTSWVSGLFSLSFGTPTAGEAAESRSPLQQSLYDYGNSAGAAMLAFEDSHPTQVEVLEAYMTERSDAAAAAVHTLASDYRTLADELGALEAPTAVRGAHADLVAAYRDAADKLDVIANTRADTDLPAVITSYSGAVSAHAESYARITTLLQTYEVRFSNSDPGAVFVFTSSS